MAVLIKVSSCSIRGREGEHYVGWSGRLGTNVRWLHADVFS